jgi:hypothetical protein
MRGDNKIMHMLGDYQLFQLSAQSFFSGIAIDYFATYIPVNNPTVFIVPLNRDGPHRIE